MFKFPFRWTPAAWGLKGDAYLEAEACYTLEGAALQRRLSEIRLRGDPDALRRKLLDIDREYGLISEDAYRRSLAELEATDETDWQLRIIDCDVADGRMEPYQAAREKVVLTTREGIEREVALLDVDYEFGKIDDHAYEKRRATLKKEPWISVINSGFDPEQGIDGVFFEFDWNTEWIDYLRLNGYTGHTEEQIVDDWFGDVCRSYVTADMPMMPYPLGAARDA